MSSTALPLHVETKGEGPPLLLLHGFGASRFTWRRWVPELAGRHTLYLVDLKGCGAAPKPRDGAYGPHDQAELLHRLVVEEDLRELAVLGHSLGGGLALLLALRLEDAGEGWRLRRLVLLEATAYAQGLPRYIGMAHRVPLVLGRLAARFVPARWLVRRILRQIVHDPAQVTEEQVRGYAAPFAEPACRHAVVEAARQLIPPDLDRLVTRYPELRTPTLLVWGRQDPVVPPWVGERLAGDLPRARLVVLDRCGHLPMEERPEAALEEVVRFLEEGG
ncbi:MAG: alpha/beta hydrolase [Gemmatimonadetes bacterium]|nr:alpha/beta hydrolase [Gemmatimonadota bacterium]